MRSALTVFALLGLAALANRAHATGYYCEPRPMPHPGMNKHCPYYIECNPYWAPCYYGFRGPTDPACGPVNGMPVPPYCPPCMRQQLYGNGQQQEQGPMWHRYMRSPRDFFMLQY